MIPASSAPAPGIPKLQRAAVGVWTLLDRRWVVMLITSVFALMFSAARLQALGGGPASFVVAGDQFVRVAAAPAGLPVTHGPGYDGQFFYRLALRPWTQHRTEFGITFDEPAYRQQRIVYPLVSFVVGRGAPAATAWVLLGCNIAAAAALGWLGAALARRRTRHALWGLAFAAYPGFVLVIARDLADLLAAALLLAGILALDRQRPVLAAATLTLAGLTRESTLVLPLALAVLWTVDAIRYRSIVAVPPGRPAWPASAASERSRVQAVTFAVPLGVALAWQLVLWRTWGVAPLVKDLSGWACRLPASGTSPEVPSSSRPSRWWCGLPNSSSWWPRPSPPRGRFPAQRRCGTRNSPGPWGWESPRSSRAVSGSRTGPSSAPSPSRICWEPLCCWAGLIGVGCQSLSPAPSCVCRSLPCMSAACSQDRPHNPSARAGG